MRNGTANGTVLLRELIQPLEKMIKHLLITITLSLFLYPALAQEQPKIAPATPKTFELVNFSGKLNESKLKLNWAIENNETVYGFELQKSTDGVEFKAAAVIFSSEKQGLELYQCPDKMQEEQAYYRLKMVAKNGAISYSNVISFL
jgi:hypothetical protein